MDRYVSWQERSEIRDSLVASVGVDRKAEKAKLVARVAVFHGQHDQKSHGNRGGGGGLDVEALLAANPRLAGEPTFVYAARVVDGLDAKTKHEVLFRIREHYEPVAYIVEGAAAYRKRHGLPEPQVDISMVKAPQEKTDAVAKAFELTPDQSDHPRVKECFDDFKRQNEEMYALVTAPVSEGGLGITVEVVKDEPYGSAMEQAADLRDNRHFKVQTGLGGEHAATMTTDEYDRFRAVHDIFGHAGVGGGFDRHGEYQAWLMHMSMYTGAGQAAMSSEYHGVNTAMWTGLPGTPGAGKSVILPSELIRNPWDAEGNLVRLALKRDAIDELIDVLDLGPGFAARFDKFCPFHFDT